LLRLFNYLPEGTVEDGSEEFVGPLQISTGSPLTRAGFMRPAKAPAAGIPMQITATKPSFFMLSLLTQSYPKNAKARE
jgi:hypothetical protein